jgi:acyl transferase domain-containing protein/surfactin synthase thioesterase subunit
VGSIKGNVGHLEAAAGLAGLLRAQLVLEHGVIPPQAGLQRLNSEIHLENTSLTIPQTAMEFPGPAPRRAGVSSFGMSGTNAHVILEAAPPAPAEEGVRAARNTHLLAVSARSDAALAELVQAHAHALATMPAERLAAWVYSANARRSHHPIRVAVTGNTPRMLGEALVRGVPSRPAASPPKLAFVFRGEGAVAQGRGRQLSAAEPEFRDLVDRGCQILEQPDLLERVASGEIERPAASSADQVVSFLTEYAIFRLLSSWGLRPHVLLGTGLGQLVAATAAGVFRFEDGLRLVARRAATRDEEWLDAMQSLAVHEPNLTVVPALDGEPNGSILGDRDYWRKSKRAVDPVASWRRIEARGIGAVVELGAFPAAMATTGGLATVKCVRPDTSEDVALMQAVTELYRMGHDPDFEALYRHHGCQLAEVPVYPFQRTLHWVQARPGPDPAARPAAKITPAATSDVAVSTTAAVSGAAAYELLLDALREFVPTDLDPDTPLEDLGIDSIMLIAVHARLEQKLGCKLPVDLDWAETTLNDLRSLLDQIAQGQPAAVAPAASVTERPVVFRFLTQRLESRLRLVCLPYAGGSSAAFAGLADLGDDVDVLALDLPGRARRRQEPFLRRFDEIADHALEGLRPLTDRPYLLYGHSFGGLLAFELVRRIVQEGGALPQHLVIGAMRAPEQAQAHHASTLAEMLRSEELWAKLERLHGTSPVALQGDELRQLVEPALRADLEALLTWQFEADAAIDVPLTVIGGTEDREVRAPDLVGWALHARQTHMYRVPGGHFFLRDAPAQLLAILRAIVAR